LKPGSARNQGGFTLVEVIIAAVILFSALVLGSLAHRASIRIIEKSNAIIAVSDAVPSIVEIIKSSLFDSRDSGSGQYGNDIIYSWSAVDTKYSTNIIGEINESRTGLDLGRFRVAMKTVTVTLTCSLYGQLREFSYEYQELVWTMLNQIPKSGLQLPKAGSTVLP
jgi:prepilin-type N-terminal cleavage/methylation domain-containing protein